MGIGVCAHSQRICLRGTQSRGTFNGRLRELSAWGVSIRPWAKFVPPWQHSALEGGLPSTTVSLACTRGGDSGALCPDEENLE